MAKHLMRVIPSTRSILSDLQDALSYEASRLAAMSGSRALTDQEHKRLVDSIKALGYVAQEEARQRNQDVLAGMTDQELAVLLSDLVAKNPELLEASIMPPKRTEIALGAAHETNPHPNRPKSVEEPISEPIRHSER